MKSVQELLKILEENHLWPLRSQAELSQRILKERLHSILPVAMKAADIDCWLIIASEYNEDPVHKSLYTWDVPHARRTSALLFHLRDDGEIDKIQIGGSSAAMNEIYRSVSDPDETIWQTLVRALESLDARRIGINKSDDFGLAAGLSASLEAQLMRHLPASLRERLVPAEKLAVFYMQQLTPLEIELMRVLTDVTHEIINMTFLKERITLNQTTTTDLEWFMRDTIDALGGTFWFGPDIDLQRKGISTSRMFHEVIRPGDLLHCDIGFRPRFISLHTDVQRLCYVLKDNEKNAPAGLSHVLSQGNQFQDIVMRQMRNGRSGNDIYLSAMKDAADAGLAAQLYTHPLGTYGHGAGPAIGLYGSTEPVPVRGDYPLKKDVCFALELNCKASVPEWDGQTVYAYLEEDICFQEEATFLSGRQTELILV